MLTRLLLAGAVGAFAGCEQSSYSSSRDLPAERTTPPVGKNASAEATDVVPATVGADQPATPVEAAQPEPAKSPAAASLPIKDYTFDDIKFEIEKDGKFVRSMLTPKIEELAGRQVRIRGYILPASTFQQSGIRNFVLVRDNQECCFGPGAALYDCIVVEMVAPATAEFTIRPVTVEGAFGIRELLDLDGVVRAIYRLDAKSVK